MRNRKIFPVIAAMTSLLLLLSGCQFSGLHAAENETVPETTAPDLSHFDGWWEISPDYEGTAAVTVFKVDTASNRWNSYNELGQSGDDMSCAFPDENTVVLNMGGLGELKLLHQDGALYGPDECGIFVHTEEPHFMEIPDFSGTWLLNGDEGNGCYYEFTQDYNKKYENTVPTTEGSYAPALANVSYVGQELNEKILYIGAEWPNPDLYPSKDGLIFMEEGAFDSNLYVRQDALDQVSPERIQLTKTLMDGAFTQQQDPEEESYQVLKFDSNFTFHTTWHVRDDVAAYSGESLPLVGTWDLQDGQILVVTYNDGTQDTVDLNGYEGTMTFANQGITFAQDLG